MLYSVNGEPDMTSADMMIDLLGKVDN
jgi:hypothetical protein